MMCRVFDNDATSIPGASLRRLETIVEIMETFLAKIDKMILKVRSSLTPRPGGTILPTFKKALTPIWGAATIWWLGGAVYLTQVNSLPARQDPDITKASHRLNLPPPHKDFICKGLWVRLPVGKQQKDGNSAASLNSGWAHSPLTSEPVPLRPYPHNLPPYFPLNLGVQMCTSILDDVFMGLTQPARVCRSNIP